MPQLTKKSPKTAIKRFQLDLEFLGFPLPHSRADGIIGSETQGAAHDAAVHFDLKAPEDFVFPPELVDGVRALVVNKQQNTIAKPPNFTDLTETAYPGPRVKKVGMAPWKGFLFHTTGAAPMGRTGWTEAQQNKRWSDHSYRNEEGVTVRTSLKSHIGITASGRILLIHPLEWFIWHAQQGSHEYWGVEVESFDYGVRGDKTTKPGGDFKIIPINDLQAKASMDLARWGDAVLRRYTGHGMTSVRTHRPYAGDRPDDIGQNGYEKIILPIMEEFGIDDGGENFTRGKGRPIPGVWNPAYPKVPYKR